MTRLNRFLADAFVELTLLDPHTNASVTVRPYDPTFGMPVQDDGKQLERLDQTAPLSLHAEFPLATVWSTLKPGTYEARVRYSFPGRYQKSWWRGTPAQWNAIWQGTVVSGPARLEISPATPKTGKRCSSQDAFGSCPASRSATPRRMRRRSRCRDGTVL